MAKEKFIDHEFNKKSLELIQIANTIMDEYRRQDYRLSLRQLYYQLVARDYIENSVKSYKRIGNLISNARNAGLVDWEMIEDRNRETIMNTHWNSPAEIVRAAANSFRIDRWEGQANYVEVMVEKDALSGVLVPVCRRLDVRFTANKGYSSSSAMYEAGKRIYREYIHSDKQIHIIYLGDHDPSGVDMTRDITDRLDLYAGIVPIKIHRLALNYDQVELWQPPENPAKETDSRFEAYADKFGYSSWELDAVEPRTLADLVTNAVLELIDEFRWQEVEQYEDEMRAKLQRFADDYKDRSE